tara:strand:+ start:256 stop:993 length:738 start_codon:yes stop_codon:yes gene_type:complete
MPQYNPDFILPTLARKPDTAHPYDDEFEGPITFNSGSDGGWWYENNGTSGSYATTPISKYNAYNSGDMRIHINETHTPSWLRAQPPKDSNLHELIKKVTFPTNMLVYCRFRFSQHIGNTTNDNPRIGFHVSTYDIQNRNYITVDVDNGKTYVIARRNDSDNGGYAQIITTTDVDSEGQAIEYLALHKVGNKYHYWAGTESNWIYMGNYTNTYTPEVIKLDFHTDNQDHIVSFDFVRFLETDKFPF